jgi:hypothetical protein
MRRCGRVLLLPLPQQVLSQRLGEFGSKHISSGRSWRQRERLSSVASSDGL